MKKLSKIAKLLEGVSSVISLFPQENQRRITVPTSSICNPLKNDWEKIGLDMWQALQAIESQQLEARHYRNNNDRFEKHPSQHL